MKGSRKRSARIQISAKAKKTKLDEAQCASERRVITPRPDLMVLKIGKENPKFKGATLTREKSSALIGKIAKATSKPGAIRGAIFRSNIGKKVYAYSIDPNDLSKFFREDAEGNRIVGQFVNGSFRPIHIR